MFYKNKKPLIYPDSYVDIALILILLGLALFSRLYYLNDFPYFPGGYPWSGTNETNLKGLYIDEAVYSGISYRFISDPSHPPIYQPALQILLMGVSIAVFGSNPFATRLPSAILSSISIILVYLICLKKFKNRLAASLSSVFLIVMTPALVMNRMAFPENSVALFFLATYYSLLKYSESEERKWIIMSAIFAGLGLLSKINGIIVPVFLIIYMFQKKILKKNVKFILITGILALIFPLTILVAYQMNPLQIIAQFAKQWQISESAGREFSLWAYTLFNGAPSGVISWTLLEYWYIFAIFSIAYVAISDREKISEVLLGLAVFYIVSLFIKEGINSYYLIIIQPLLAIPVGYALTKMKRMSTYTTLFFYIFFYAQLLITIDVYIISAPEKFGLPILSPILVAIKLIQLAIPLLLILLSSIRSRFSYLREVTNIGIVGVFLTALFICSYIIRVFYSYYFPPGTDQLLLSLFP